MRQDGVVALRQLLQAGLARDSIARLLSTGWLHEIHPRVYAVGQPRLSEQGRLAAALLHAGPGAALSHTTAAWWWELTKHAPSRIEVSTPRRVRSRDSVRVYARRRLHRVLHRQLPVTPVPQTLLDYASCHRLDDVRYVLSEADFRNLLDVAQIDQTLGRGSRGAQRLRCALTAHRPELALTRSELERAFVSFCEERDLPLPQINARVCGMTVDAFWPEQRVVVELDGYQGHRTKAQLERDHARDLRLRAANLITLRYTRRQLLHEADALYADLVAALDD